VGEGTAWYVATALDAPGVARIVAEVCDEAGLAPRHALPVGVEVVRRVGDGRSYLFVLNHTTEPVEVPADGFDLRHNQAVDGSTTVTAGGAVVIRERI
jgi:beta-galactosidase